MRIPAKPTIYEINTAAWLQRLGRGGGRGWAGQRAGGATLGLGEVPGSEWDALAALPVDAGG